MTTDRPPKTHRVIPRWLSAFAVATPLAVIVVLPLMLAGARS